MLKSKRPKLQAIKAQQILLEHFSINGLEVAELPSERDQIFVIKTQSENLILKISNSSEPYEVLELQTAALKHIATVDTQLPIPKVYDCNSGKAIAKSEEDNFCQLLSFLPGKPLAKTNPHSNLLLHSIGNMFGRLDCALRNFTHPAQNRHLYWDTKNAPETIEKSISYIKVKSEQKLVIDILNNYQSTIEPILPELPCGLIHNDGNDFNILVNHGQISGIIDFGDIVESCLVFEVANLATYCMLRKPNPLLAATYVVKGYHEARQLSEEELLMIFPLIQLRLALSISVCALQSHEEPNNNYLSVSSIHIRKLLAQLDMESEHLAHYRFRDACGLNAHPKSRVVNKWLTKHQSSVLPFDLASKKVHFLDLSIGSNELGNLCVLDNVQSFTDNLLETIKTSGAQIGIGQYNEARPLYNNVLFRKHRNAFETRTIHLGIDLFVGNNTLVIAPIDGTVHSFKVNDASLDYGPTIILKHQLNSETELVFFTLYGHLSKESLNNLSVGKKIDKGDPVGFVGSSEANGGWPPHLHFQIILDMLNYEGDFPGVALPSERNLWLDICPNPSEFLGLKTPKIMNAHQKRKQMLKKRGKHLSKALSLSYRKPLHIVRGHGMFLYDEFSQRYLDMVNNVSHVGHCHPAVIDAAYKQLSILNTNTRYLHENILNYAQKLTGSLPEGLDVCFFVNSGSEANDLALRLARNYNNRNDTLVLEGGYHGNLTSLIEISPYKHDGPGGNGAPPHVHTLDVPDGYRGKFRSSDPEYTEKYLQQAQLLIENLSETSRPIGTLITESILSCGGQILLPPNYLKKLYQLVRATGGLCISDEVQIGFGRIGTHFWGFSSEGVVPDIVTMGKPIGNGYPMGAVVTTSAIAQAFETGMEYFNTFGGNPVSCAIGTSVLEIMEKQKLQSNAAEIGEYLLNGLNEIQATHPIIGDVRGKGLFLGLELVTNRELRTPATNEAASLVNRMMEEGVLLSTDGLHQNVIKIKPPLILSRNNSTYFLDKLDNVLSEDRFTI